MPVIPEVKNEGYMAAPNSFFRADGHIETIFTNEKKDLVAVDENGSRVQLSPPAQNVAGRYPFFYHEGQRVYVMFWDKAQTGEKRLYLSRSEDGGKSFGPAQTLAAGGVLARYGFASDGAGRIAVIYMDESKPKGYEIYVNVSNDFGATWGSKPVRLDGRPIQGEQFQIQFGLEPQVAWKDGVLVAVWKEQGMNAQQHLRESHVLSSYSRDGGTSWSAPVFLAKNQPVAHETLKSRKEGLYYFGALNEGVAAFFSPDGAQWKNLGLLEGAYTIPAEFDSAEDESGIHVVFTGRTLDENRRVFYGELTQGGWKAPAKPIFEGDHYTNSRTPALAKLGDGSLAVAWQDTATILPSIMLARKPVGATWAKPVALDEAGHRTMRYPRLIADGNRAALLYERVVNDFSMNGAYQRLDLDTSREDFGLHAPKLQDASAKPALLARVNEYWESKVAGNDKYRAYFDPIYQVKNSGPRSDEEHVKVRYHKFSIEDKQTRIEDNVAHVVVDYEFSIDTTVIDGKIIGVDHKPDRVLQTWVWVNGDWFLRVEPSMGSPLLQF